MPTFSVATFNIRHCLGLDGVIDVERTASVISALGADIVMLQEVDVGWERSGSVAQPALLAAATGMTVTFHPTFERADGAKYGLAVASTVPLEVVYEALEQVEPGEPRGMVRTTFEGTSIWGTHLSRNPANRAHQIAHLATMVRDTDGPLVLAGDLNTSRKGLGPLLAAGLDAGPRRRTLPARLPRTQIDFVLAGQGARHAAARTVPTAASDHRPLVANIAV